MILVLPHSAAWLLLHQRIDTLDPVDVLSVYL